MTLGVSCGLLAGAFWGLVFLTPRLLPDFSPWELSLGRYVCYGAIALIFLAPRLRQTVARVDRHDLLAMTRQALTGNIIYYVLLAYGVQLAGIAPTSLIIGLLPLVVTLMGRADHGAIALRELTWPLLMVAAGIACINIDLFQHSMADPQRSLLQSASGVLCAILAMLSWSWYTVDNSRYLQRHHKFSSSQWSALYGLATGAIALLLGLAGLAWLGGQTLAPAAHGTGRDWTLFWLLNLGLALGASMIGNQLWNLASRRVPVTLSGQLIISETVFALLYGFLYAQQAPRPLELCAIALLLGGVAWAVQRHATKPGRPLAGEEQAHKV
jgi:drug/metabolite transporter (DMT)-like permease